MKKHLFRIFVVVLIVILAVVSFYMLYVHVPYYNYYHGLDEIRNEICEKNNYQYLDYFYEYHGQDVYYVLKVKVNNQETYVAYNQDQELVATHQGEIADENEVKKAIEEKYKDNHVVVDKLEVGYENDKFVYYTKYQDDHLLLYIYYHLNSGEFMKAVRLEE